VGLEGQAGPIGPQVSREVSQNSDLVYLLLTFFFSNSRDPLGHLAWELWEDRVNG
jgi:hypothetical protein